MNIRAHIRLELEKIDLRSEAERAQWRDAMAWLDSGAPLFRTEKPATPKKHLVAYFPVVDGEFILLVNHRNAQLWLPTGGHVEPNESPRSTVVRELAEELGVTISQDCVPAPVLVTVTETVGLTRGHTDVSLWFPIQRSRAQPLIYDENEFSEIRWFHRDEALGLQSDPNLALFLSKLESTPDVANAMH